MLKMLFHRHQWKHAPDYYKGCYQIKVCMNCGLTAYREDLDYPPVMGKQPYLVFNPSGNRDTKKAIKWAKKQVEYDWRGKEEIEEQVIKMHMMKQKISVEKVLFLALGLLGMYLFKLSGISFIGFR